MSYQAPTLKIKYMKPAYLEMADKGFTTPSQADREFGTRSIPMIVAITGGVRASVDSGEKIGTTAGEQYVKRCGTGTY